MSEVEIIKGNNSRFTHRRGRAIEQRRVAAYCRVSTDDEDQLSSYKSQVTYYKDLINNNPEWVFAGIYADEAITGTQTVKREDFQRMINDCMNGDIDMVITKSISRFARNTLDTLKYVRMFKEKDIAVFFEDEKINTLTMDGELLLVVLSSVAQQEVENISANVKKGLKMKMSRGEITGFQGCIGYDYNPEDRTLTINEKEAEIVRYIFERYVQGAGGKMIAKELEALGYKTKKGNTKWQDGTILRIIKNEKYKGDLLMGKTFTVDPITKRRLSNFGEEDQYYITNHHEPIVSAEIFEKAEAIRTRRNKNKLRVDRNGGKREKYSRKYPFSSLLECPYCGSKLSRRSWHSGSSHNKRIWHCMTSSKKGKQHCPESKGIQEEIIEKAFLESYRLMCNDNQDVLEEFLERMEKNLSVNTAYDKVSKIEVEIEALEKKKNKLIDMRIEGSLDKEIYEDKYNETIKNLDDKKRRKAYLKSSLDDEKDIQERLIEFRKLLEKEKGLNTFDRYVFESIIEKVIVGGVDKEGNNNPYKLTFIYKIGTVDSLDGNSFKPPRKNKKKESVNELYSNTEHEENELCPNSNHHTCGGSRVTVEDE
ncbi:recombinase family protein [Oceanobacillus sojae]|uniref:recombinase family protein n=1 Tax=Oceanobacillus sojae TaxID=582851 RepID=UPI0021A6ECD3|nr:recombinase family protein [Oceanobacillus sojae]MCT1905253.1 recombinase family protein [Oceanobacillus sojae]